MATREVVTMTDDLDSKKTADTTVRFELDGSSYEIDLSDSNADALRTAFKPYVDAARRTGGRAPRGSGGARRRTASPGAVDTAVVKAWADSHGVEYNKRGRLPASLLVQFQEATS